MSSATPRPAASGSAAAPGSASSGGTASPARPAARYSRPALLAGIVCVLALVAAIVAFADGSWLGVPFLLLAAVDGNIAWFYARKARRASGAAGGAEA